MSTSHDQARVYQKSAFPHWGWPWSFATSWIAQVSPLNLRPIRHCQSWPAVMKPGGSFWKIAPKSQTKCQMRQIHDKVMHWAALRTLYSPTSAFSAVWTKDRIGGYINVLWTLSMSRPSMYFSNLRYHDIGTFCWVSGLHLCLLDVKTTATA